MVTELRSESADVCSNRHTSFDSSPSDHQVLPRRPMSTVSPATNVCDNCGSYITRWATEMNIDLLDAEIVRRLQATIAPLRRRRNSLLPILRLPNELLQKIFSISNLQRSHSDEVLVQCGPMPLSQVCQVVEAACVSQWKTLE
jgi:hypothetical protein